jgi:hypothetical protein
VDGTRTDEADTPDDSGTRNHGWYAARMLLAIGLGAVLLVLGLFLFEPAYMGTSRRMWQNPLVLAAFLGMVVGLVWMIRIFRGRRDEPPPWRYRDR